MLIQPSLEYGRLLRRAPVPRAPAGPRTCPEVTLQLADAASQVAALQLAATQAARILKKKMMKEEACDLFVLNAVLQAARPPPLSLATPARAAIRAPRLRPVCWSGWPLPGTPQLPPVELASRVST